MRPVEVEYEAQMLEIGRNMAMLSPNMRAADECLTAEEKLGEVQQSQQDAASENKRLAKEFEAVKAERTRLFMRCFRHVEASVSPNYRELTSYGGREGGSAYLDLDDAEEPYSGGIQYTACPPGKRFFPMEFLSGGERSMASMALLFSMHSFQPPPFMVLDEVDAPFDRENTKKLIRYLKTVQFQCLVISLKDTFYAHSDAIV